MSGETEQAISGWTVDTYRVHNEAMRSVEERVEHWRDQFLEERDRRYAEVGVEKEKALKIKEEADRAALQLDREIQKYKDEKANEFRGSLDDLGKQMATRRELEAAFDRIEVSIRPLSDYVTAQQGRSQGIDNFTKLLIAAVGIVVALAGLYFATRATPTAAGAAYLLLGMR